MSLIPGNETYTQKALRRSENERLAEKLATRIGEQILRDYLGHFISVDEGVAQVILYDGGPTGIVEVNAYFLESWGIFVGDSFSCRITTKSAHEVVWSSPHFVPAKTLPTSEIFHLRKRVLGQGP